MPTATAEAWRGNLSGYDVILTYSDFVRSHVQAGLAARQVPPIATEVVYPPVVMQRGDAAAKQAMILSVGRFIAGGHTKRHDALIDAFRVLFHRFGGGIEYHIVGSSFPTPEDMAYLAALQAAATDLPVVFHVNAKEHTVETLYRQAMFYWHATGYGLQASAAPERAEHFGISVVEAMSAGCVPLAYASGGPCEIIRQGRTGFLFETLDELVERTAGLMQPARSGDRIGMGRAAADAARRFSPDAFAARIAQLSDTYPGDAADGDQP
jgi:glycosyltransferase involved in cell wall biosynthesis